MLDIAYLTNDGAFFLQEGEQTTPLHSGFQAPWPSTPGTPGRIEREKRLVGSLNPQAAAWKAPSIAGSMQTREQTMTMCIERRIFRHASPVYPEGRKQRANASTLPRTSASFISHGLH